MQNTTPNFLSDFTVLVPTLGREVLRDCLHSIESGDSWPHELVVVDQGSNSAVSEWLYELDERGLRTRHIKSDQRGTAAATNRGLEHVRTHWVAVTHDDCRVAPDWLSCMALRLRENPGSIITGMVIPEAEGHTPSVITTPYSMIFTHPLLDRDPLFPANMGFAVETAGRVGPFSEDPRVRFAEDAEWSYRALQAGVTIVYAPEVVVEHRDWRDHEQLAVTYRRYARSQGGFYGLYLRRGDWFIAARAAFDLLRGPWIWARGSLTGHQELAIIGRAYITQLLPGIAEGLRRKPWQ